jgi:hypothetical protein
MMCSCKINVIYDHQHWWVDYNIFILIQNDFINLLQIQFFKSNFILYIFLIVF